MKYGCYNLVKFESNMETYIEVVIYLLQPYTSQELIEVFERLVIRYINKSRYF